MTRRRQGERIGGGIRPATYHLERLDGRPARLAVSGEVDMATTGVLGEQLARAQASGAPLVLDLTGVTFLDSTGVCTLLRAARAGRTTDWDLTMVPPAGHPLRVLELCGAHDWLPFAVAR